MAISFLKLASVRNVSLALVAFIFMFCGCSNEPLLVEIAYETQAISESPGTNAESAPIAGDAGLANEAQNQNNDAVNAASSQAEGADGTPQATYRASAALAPSPAVTQTPQLTFTPWPTLTPTPSPTIKPTPTATPSPTPTAAPSPSPKATANLQAAINAETERYEQAIKSIQSEYDTLINTYSDMLRNLQGKTASSPEDAAALQAEIDALQARIDNLARETATKMSAELERHLAAVASLRG